jgi:dTDP-4-amino-4,6-dideoxygalactose transaminase
VRPEFAGAERSRIFDDLRGRGVGVNVHYMPVHLQPFYKLRGFFSGQYPESEAYGDTAITLPLYPRLTDDMQDQVISHVTLALERAG